MRWWTSWWTVSWIEWRSATWWARWWSHAWRTPHSWRRTSHARRWSAPSRWWAAASESRRRSAEWWWWTPLTRFTVDKYKKQRRLSLLDFQEQELRRVADCANSWLCLVLKLYTLLLYIRKLYLLHLLSSSTSMV